MRWHRLLQRHANIHVLWLAYLLEAHPNEDNLLPPVSILVFCNKLLQLVPLAFILCVPLTLRYFTAPRLFSLQGQIQPTLTPCNCVWMTGAQPHSSFGPAAQSWSSVNRTTGLWDMMSVFMLKQKWASFQHSYRIMLLFAAGHVVNLLTSCYCFSEDKLVYDHLTMPRLYCKAHLPAIHKCFLPCNMRKSIIKYTWATRQIHLPSSCHAFLSSFFPVPRGQFLPHPPPLPAVMKTVNACASIQVFISHPSDIWWEQHYKNTSSWILLEQHSADIVTLSRYTHSLILFITRWHCCLSFSGTGLTAPNGIGLCTPCLLCSSHVFADFVQYI